MLSIHSSRLLLCIHDLEIYLYAADFFPYLFYQLLQTDANLCKEFIHLFGFEVVFGFNNRRLALHTK